MKTTLFLPVRNEIVGIKAIMPKIRREWVDEIIFIDGHSTDGTYEYLVENGYTVYKQKSKGLCGAYWECLEVATGDYIIVFSPDNNCVPEYIPLIVSEIKSGCDLLVVSRYLDWARSEDDDIVTSFGNWMFTTMVNVLFGAKYTDVLGMLRAFRKDLFADLNMVERNHPVLEIMMAIRCAKRGLVVREIPGDEPKRIGGVRKMSPLYNGSMLLMVIFKEVLSYPTEWFARLRTSQRKSLD